MTSLYVSKFLFLIAVSGLAREEVALHVAVTVKIKRALPQIELACRGERDPFMMKLTYVSAQLCNEIILDVRYFIYVSRENRYEFETLIETTGIRSATTRGGRGRE